MTDREVLLQLLGKGSLETTRTTLLDYTSLALMLILLFIKRSCTSTCAWQPLPRPPPACDISFFARVRGPGHETNLVPNSNSSAVPPWGHTQVSLHVQCYRRSHMRMRAIWHKFKFVRTHQTLLFHYLRLSPGSRLPSPSSAAQAAPSFRGYGQEIITWWRALSVGFLSALHAAEEDSQGAGIGWPLLIVPGIDPES